MQRLRNYVNGQWVAATAADYLSVVNPATEEQLAEVPVSSAVEVDAAVGAARAAQLDWEAAGYAARAAQLDRWAEAVGADADALAEAECLEVDETFGPVAAIQVVGSFEEAVREASHSAYGLAAAEQISAGIIWVNGWQTGFGVFEPARNSGMGAFGATASLDAATRPASIAVAETR